MELGLYTFADVDPNPTDGRGPEAARRLKNLLEEIELADQVGLDVFGLGEHHRPDYAVSSPSTVLAAAAVKTKNIRLSSAVSVLSSDDPVRVFQQFSTVDLLSNGRAEIMAGRGSFIESYPLFGYNLEDYDVLFAEKLDLLLALRESEIVTWSGTKHPPINGRGVYPRPLQDMLPVWIAVGGTPESVARAGAMGLPVALAIIGGEYRRFAPLFDLYREAARRAGQDISRQKTSINVHGFIADTTQAAADQFYQGTWRFQERPLPAADGNRHDATRSDHAGHRALRYESRADGQKRIDWKCRWGESHGMTIASVSGVAGSG
jgi:probable LLM family oxidoreductase